jgi:hypothetical protein
VHENDHWLGHVDPFSGPPDANYGGGYGPAVEGASDHSGTGCSHAVAIRSVGGEPFDAGTEARHVAEPAEGAVRVDPELEDCARDFGRWRGQIDGSRARATTNNPSLSLPEGSTTNESQPA